MKTRQKKKAPVLSLAADGQGANQSDARAGVKVLEHHNREFPLCQDVSESGPYQPADDPPPFPYVIHALKRFPFGGPPPTGPGDAWLRIVAQIELTRPFVADELHLRAAGCQIISGRLVISPLLPGAAYQLAKFASAPTCPITVAAALAGLSGLEIVFKEEAGYVW